MGSLKRVLLFLYINILASTWPRVFSLIAPLSHPSTFTFFTSTFTILYYSLFSLYSVLDLLSLLLAFTSFTMNRSPSYDGRSGSRGSHSNSSAFSPNANANEDWTKISDLAERRRIQNRIAQRNYRKKLKRRLEDLERRAATSASPEQSHAEPVSPKPSPKTRTKQRSSKPTDVKPHSQSDRSASYDYYSPEDRQTMFAQQCTRQLSASPPPVFSYPSMSSYDTYRQSVYSQSPIYHAAPSTYSEIAYQTEYGEPAPSLVPVLPSMQARKLAYDEDLISPFSMSYATMAGIDLCQQQAQAQSHSQHQPSALPMPALAYYEDRPSTSPEASIFTFPLTPESAPCSPRMHYEYDLRP
ncbi:hypothetical protein N7465_001734 [Penicillium sp. CMV-2018d]|nr:hypothetical protein N7465_001734 [Penicillium sp. CMV-2018d]